IWYRSQSNSCSFFQAEDGIRDDLVTGVQTCALPILIFSPEGVSRRGGPSSLPGRSPLKQAPQLGIVSRRFVEHGLESPEFILGEIGRASCRVRLWLVGVHDMI